MWLESRFVCLVVLLLIASPCFAAKYVVRETLQTDFGRLQSVNHLVDSDGKLPEVVDSAPYEKTGPPAPILLLSGKKVFEGDEFSPYLKFLGTYSLPNEQAVLFSDDCGGSGCRIHSLHLLLLRTTGSTVAISDPNFYSETIADDEIKGRVSGGQLVVELGYENQKQKTAILASDHLRILQKAVGQTALSDQDCGVLYNLQDDCAEHRIQHPDCADIQSASENSSVLGASSASWALRRASHTPGYNRAGFDRMCHDACVSATKTNYAAFKGAACTTRQ